jgi:prepilin-type N-terminal cleavage/methylation domain-containing protein/prepilin-type processing-associated H-X9-DG protein
MCAEVEDMDRKNAFTLIELLVVIAIIAILMAILMPTLSRAREQGKRAACLSNVKQLALSWNLYADDYDGRMVNANTGASAPTIRNERACWVYWSDPASAPQEQRLQSIRTGLLYRYCPDVKLYKCPTGVRGEVVTYSIPDTLNGYYHIPGAKEQIKLLRTQIRNPSQQIVFLDEGRLSPSSWTIWYDQERWWDQITARHGDGTNFAFADGHSEYWKWKDPRTLAVAKADYAQWQNTGRHAAESTQMGNHDLQRVQRGVFGRLGYTPPICEGDICRMP